MKAIGAVVLALAASVCYGGSWGMLSSGLDMSHLGWELGDQLSWGFQTLFGVEVFDDLYLCAKATIPAPTFVIIGNQICAGGSVTHLPLNNGTGFALQTSLGVSRCWMWPEHVIVILADGETNEPPPEYDFDSAVGMRYEVLVSPGYRWGDIALRLDLGLDHRSMEVERFIQNRRVTGDYTFTGLHTGLSLDVYF
ncbi:MAG: hypothetical protein GF388_09695 [Candidatus Aegiribacteria sp.]|nr:hypothetical protein [Candidatus Aegiribacteria sp.]MBD3295311.1 hypothetical protein [Candidatus Fermentibacteria bacterium]